MNLAHDNVLLLCERGHEHIVGDIQVAAILPTPCPWCRTALHVARRGTEAVKHAAVYASGLRNVALTEHASTGVFEGYGDV